MGRRAEKLARRFKGTREAWRDPPGSGVRGAVRYNLQGVVRRWNRTRTLWRLRADIVSGLRIVLVYHRWPRRRRGTPRPLSVRLASPAGPVRVHLQQREDFWTCREVFDEGHYDVQPGPFPVEWFVDLGCNTGIATRYLAHRHRPRHTVAVEADPSTLEMARRNLPEGSVAIPAVIAAADGRAAFFRHSQSTGSTIFPRPGTGDPVDLPARGLDSLCRELGIPRIDLLKFDIEGAEFTALPVSERAREARILIGEVHSALANRPLSDFLGSFPHHRWMIRRIPSGHVLVTGRHVRGGSRED